MLARSVALAYAAANRRDLKSFYRHGFKIYGYRPSPDLRPLDLDATFYGQDGYLRLWRYWSTRRGHPVEAEEILDIGERPRHECEQRGRRLGSGVVVSGRFQLFTVRRGLIVRQEDFLDRSEALDAAGVRV